MKTLYFIHLILLCCLLISCKIENSSFEIITPEEAGFSSKKLKVVQEFLEQYGSAAFLALYDGKVFFNWGDIAKKYPLHSIRKPLLSALYGIYIERGKIDLNHTLKDLNIDDIEPKLSEIEKQAKVIDLIQSKSGIYHQAAAESSEMIIDRPERGSHEPGTFFYYNNWDFNALATIFEQQTGQNIFDSFYEDIAQLIGMKHYKGSYEKVYDLESYDDIPPTDGFYQYENDKSLHPAYHFRMSTNDLALFGVLYMKNGNWGDKRIIPTKWINKSTMAYSIADEQIGLGYGYLWYVLPQDENLGRCFLHTGNGVHMLAVFPDIKLVIVHRVDTENQYNFSLENLFELWDIFFSARD